MANFLNDFKKMIDISEESELLAKMEEGGAKAQGEKTDENFGLVVEKTQEMLRKKNAAYQGLLKEVVAVKNEFDEYKAKAGKDIRALKKELAAQEQTNKELTLAQNGDETADAYTSDLTRQIEELKKNLETVEAEAARYKSRANELEMAREVAEAESKANLEAMNAKMEAWKKRTEANQDRARQEIAELQDKLRRAKKDEAPAGSDTDGGASEELKRKLDDATREAEALRKEVEELQWDNLQQQNAVGEMAQNLEERNTRLRSFEKEEAGRVESYKTQIASLENQIQALEQNAEHHQRALDEAKASQERKLETLDNHQQHKQRELQTMKVKIDELERTVTSLTYQLENEKNSVEQIMQHLDDTKAESSRKDEAFNDLYHHNEEARARLQSLEAQTITLQTTLETRNEALSGADREKRELEDRLHSTQKELEEVRDEVRKRDSHVNELEKSARSMEQVERDLRFKLDKVKGELMVSAGGEKEAQIRVDSKEEEVARLKQQVMDLMSQKDEVSAKLRTALSTQEKPQQTTSQRSRSVAARPGSPTVVDILRSAGEKPLRGGAAHHHHQGPSSWTTTRAMVLILITLCLLLGMYHGQASSIVTSSDELELQKSIAHLRSVVTAQEKLIDVCKTKGIVP